MINLPQNIIAHETMKKIGVFRNTLHEPTDLTCLSSKKLDKIYRKLLTNTVDKMLDYNLSQSFITLLLILNGLRSWYKKVDNNWTIKLLRTSL